MTCPTAVRVYSPLSKTRSFQPDRILTVHWDGKIVPSLTGKSNEEREAIIVTGVNTNQMLGTPALPNGTAKVIAKAVVDALQKWEIHDNVRAMSFDTTSVNTGCKSGAALTIERLLGRDLLWLPCRHHVFERVLENVFHAVLGPSTGPDIELFKTFQGKWGDIDQRKFSAVSKHLTRKFFSSDCDTIIEFAKNQIEDNQPRDDYREILKLTIIFLGGVPAKGIRFFQPGPMNSARWMAKAIYALKMWLFRSQWKLSRAEEDGLFQVSLFVVKIYIQAWFPAPCATSAPRIDLQFLKHLVTYGKINMTVAKAAQKVFLNHLWYLSEEVIGLSLFDKAVSNGEKEQIVQSMKTREGSEDPPKKAVVQLSDLESLALADLATKSSLRFFNILEIGTAFFDVPVEDWEKQQDYQTGLNVLTHLRVVNDHAERGVKLFKDFNKSVTRKEDSFQNLLLTAGEHRKKLPDVKKNTLVSQYGLHMHTDHP